MTKFLLDIHSNQTAADGLANYCIHPITVTWSRKSNGKLKSTRDFNNKSHVYCSSQSIKVTTPAVSILHSTDDDDTVLTLISETLYIPPISDTTSRPCQSCPMQSRTPVPSFLYSKNRTYPITYHFHRHFNENIFLYVLICYFTPDTVLRVRRQK